MIEVLRDEETRVLRFLNRFTLHRAHDLVEVFQGRLLVSVCRYIETTPFQRLEDIWTMFESFGFDSDVTSALAQELVEYAYEKLLEKANEKLGIKMRRYTNRGANRAKYLEETVFTYYRYVDGPPAPENYRWRFDPRLCSAGLATELTNCLFGELPEPVAIGINHVVSPTQNRMAVNSAPARDDVAIALFAEQMDTLNKRNMAVSKGKLAWNTKSPFWPLMLRCFPDEIDLEAYNHGLNAPILPKGYLPNVNITFKVIRDDKNNDLQTDGSGLYHPDTPELQGLIEKYGLAPFQLRAIEPTTGTFVKGIMFPSTLAVDTKGNPGIVLDWLQIKGRNKALAKQRRSENATKIIGGFHFGVILTWSKPGTLAGCFEALENIKTNAQTIAITKKLVERAMAKLEARGLDGLVADVARKDETIKFMCQLVAAGRAEGLNIHAYQIPRVREAVADKLAKVLYVIAQGAGLRLPSYVCRMDSQIPRGHCVLSNVYSERQVVGFRFPLILPQGLLKFKTMKPLDHHLVDGHMSPNTVIMNPADCTLAQGDDDGDIFGFTDDPDLVELFEHKLDQECLLIEPKGKPILGKDGKTLKSGTPEGFKRMQRDHRDNVGRVTIWRSRLLAIGDYHGARALSIAIQECVDCPKRDPEWSNIFLAAQADKWKTDENGNKYFDIRFKPRELEDGGFPLNAVKRWVNRRLINAGCCTTQYDPDGTESIVAVDPLWWRRTGKRIVSAEWSVPPESEETQSFENLVHVSTRHAFHLWQKLHQQFVADNETTLEMPVLLPMVLAARGIKAPPEVLDPDQYEYLRDRVGLNDYNKAVQTAMARGRDIDGNDLADDTHEVAVQMKRSMLNEAQIEFQDHMRKGWEKKTINMIDITTIWQHECREGGRINDAFRVVCWEESEVLKALGIAQAGTCPYLTKKVQVRNREVTRLDYMIEIARQQPDPFVAVQEIIDNSKQHQQEHKDRNSIPIYLHECPHCMATIQTELVRSIRATHVARTQKWMKQLHMDLKQS